MEEINGTVMELRLCWSGAVISEFTQQDGSGKRVAKKPCVTDLPGPLLACFVMIFT